MERYRDRLDTVTASLSTLEVEDLVTIRDVTTVLQRAEMVRRIAQEVAGYIVELGTDGRLIRLQADELLAGVEDDRRAVIRDYLPDDGSAAVDAGLVALQVLETDRLLDAATVAEAVTLAGRHVGMVDLDAGTAPRGYRLLGKVPRLSAAVIANIVDRFATMQKVMAATVEELVDVDGVDQNTAATVKDGLARLAESSIMDRYS